MSSSIRTAIRFSAAPTARTSVGPDGSTRTLRSPRSKPCAAPSKLPTLRTTVRAIRSETTTAAPTSDAPSRARINHARHTPRRNCESGTSTRTTAVLALVRNTGSYTTVPPATRCSNT